MGIRNMIDFILLFTAVLGRTSIASTNARSASRDQQITLNSTYDNVTHLINSMLKSYDIRLRPNFGEGAVQLELELAVATFDKVSEVDMDFTVTLYLYQYWRDERLAWLPGLRNESITLGGDFSQKIWVPDTFMANDKESYLHDVTEANKMLRLHSDGYIAYGMRFTSTLACRMDLRSFPLDRQNFSVEIESYGYTTADLFMRWKNGRNSVRGIMQSEMPQFRIIDYDTLARVVKTGTGSYQRLSLVLILRRSIGYYMFQSYFPSTLIVALSWISFWINHEATAARVALGVTTVLTMTTISNSVRNTLPRISYIKAIDIYLVMCFVFVFAALLEYAAVNYTYWGSTRTGRKNRRRSDAPDHEYSARRKMTTNQAREFPTWEMYVQNEDDENASPQSCTYRGRSQTTAPDQTGSDEDEDLRRSPRDQEPDDVLTPDQSIAIRRSSSGRVSPIPGLLQQRRQITPEPQYAERAASVVKEEKGSWASLSEFRRPPSPPVTLHTGSLMTRRRPPSSSAINASCPYEEQLLEDTTNSGASKMDRRRTHPLQMSKRRCVSFSIWRSSGRNPNSAPASTSSSARFHPHRHTSLSMMSRREFVTSLRRKAKAVTKALPRIHDVNVIDKWSRGMFPLSFILFNLVYWCYYLFTDWND